MNSFLVINKEVHFIDLSSIIGEFGWRILVNKLLTLDQIVGRILSSVQSRHWTGSNRGISGLSLEGSSGTQNCQMLRHACLRRHWTNELSQSCSGLNFAPVSFIWIFTLNFRCKTLLVLKQVKFRGLCSLLVFPLSKQYKELYSDFLVEWSELSNLTLKAIASDSIRSYVQRGQHHLLLTVAFVPSVYVKWDAHIISIQQFTWDWNGGLIYPRYRNNYSIRSYKNSVYFVTEIKCILVENEV